MGETQKQSLDHVRTTVKDVSVGDSVSLGVTHQVKIDGLDSWIKLEVTSQVRENEGLAEAMDRVGYSLASKVVSEIERQASVIVEANATQR